jgi:excisionase family DNA binding protein
MEEGIQGYITTKQAAERGSIDPSHVVRLLQQGKIRGVKVGRDWLVIPESLDHYLANRGWAKARRKKAREAKAKKTS